MTLKEEIEKVLQDGQEHSLQEIVKSVETQGGSRPHLPDQVRGILNRGVQAGKYLRTGTGVYKLALQTTQPQTTQEQLQAQAQQEQEEPEQAQEKQQENDDIKTMARELLEVLKQ